MKKKYVTSLFFIGMGTQALYAISIEERLALLSKAGLIGNSENKVPDKFPFSQSSNGGQFSSSFNELNESDSNTFSSPISNNTQSNASSQSLNDTQSNASSQSLNESQSNPSSKVSNDSQSEEKNQDPKRFVQEFSAQETSQAPGLMAQGVEHLTKGVEQVKDYTQNEFIPQATEIAEQAGHQAKKIVHDVASQAKETGTQIINYFIPKIKELFAVAGKKMLYDVANQAKENGTQVVNYFSPKIKELFEVVGQKVTSWANADKEQASASMEDSSSFGSSNSSTENSLIPQNNKAELPQDAFVNKGNLGSEGDKESTSMSTESSDASNSSKLPQEPKLTEGENSGYNPKSLLVNNTGQKEPSAVEEAPMF
ncbi:hypothetical protein [Holospora curviuscula]|uniref:Uncharacterized protein n=1 Tax=Holospora curviuscula TaxID=1082868 RepID=A0A2S5R9R0_9PROT|nr:hypothetical protein [Holospora curviuscula]PPE04054.1 hypothetical protein HCUR_00589 [Holospora curviuscula]